MLVKTTNNTFKLGQLVVEEGALQKLPILLRAFVRIGEKVVVLTHPSLYNLYGNLLQALEFNYKLSVLTLNEGEEYKTEESLHTIYNHLYLQKCNRKSVILAFGGGMIGDLATMAASTYLRGCLLVQVPTSLLAQVDSCLGGKGAINFQGIKNLIGTFYPAHLVVVDPLLLQSLYPKDFTSGMGEVIKYGLIGNASLFKRLVALNSQSVKPHLPRLIKECLAIKKKLVEQDPFDRGERLKLNFGHTLGHAIEAVSEGKIAHGQAVAFGMVVMVRWGEELGITPKGLALRLEKLLIKWNLPIKLKNFETLEQKQALVKAMLQDKKGEGESIKLVFVKKPGCAVIKKMSLNCLNEMLNFL